MSIVVLIDFMAILLTPGIFLLQIVNKNMYLIHFHSKNIIKMHFPKVVFLKFQTGFGHSLSIVTRWNKLRWQQQRRHNTVLKTNFQKKNLIIICIVPKFYRFFDTFFKILKKEWKWKFKTYLQSIVVHTIQSRFFFFFEIKIEWLNWFWVRPT